VVVVTAVTLPGVVDSELVTLDSWATLVVVVVEISCLSQNQGLLHQMKSLGLLVVVAGVDPSTGTYSLSEDDALEESMETELAGVVGTWSNLPWACRHQNLPLVVVEIGVLDDSLESSDKLEDKGGVEVKDWVVGSCRMTSQGHFHQKRFPDGGEVVVVLTVDPSVEFTPLIAVEVVWEVSSCLSQGHLHQMRFLIGGAIVELIAGVDDESMIGFESLRLPELLAV
jgi:hypothetical protein